MPPNDPDPMFAAFRSACERDAAIERREARKAEARQRWDEAFHDGMNSMYDDGPHTAKEAGERLQRVIDDWQAQHPDHKVVYGDSIVPIPWPVGEPSAWMPAPAPPCIRREASRVYRWLILAAAMALLLVAMANSKGCEGQQATVKGGSNG